MNTIFINGSRQNDKPTVLACGFFDGIHIGHQDLFMKAKKISSEEDIDFSILTFSRSPKSIFSGKEKLVTNLTQRLKYFEEFNADNAFVYEATTTTMLMNGKAFIEILIKNNVKHIICGNDFKFGDKGKNTWKDIERLSQHKIKVSTIDFQKIKKLKVSTTQIVEQIEIGNVEKINHLLYKPFTIIGSVVRGKQLGRKIGFATANIILEKTYVIPLKGVYETQFLIDGKCYKSITNIGNNPTIDNDENIKVESHILDFNQNIYGKVIGIRFIKFIRPEIKFSSIDVLKKQIKKDVNTIK